LNPNRAFSSFPRRLLIATAIWIVFWPIFWFIKIGDITGAKSWFWIIGELNYPIALGCFIVVDFMLERVIKAGWIVFSLSVIAVAAATPYLYVKYGFSMAVLIEAVVRGFFK